MTYYAQYGEDAAIERFFEGKRGGSFVDVGAYDGVHFSNTYMLEQEYGWRGICVEANPETFVSLMQKRPLAHLWNCACIEPGQEGMITLFVPAIPLLSTLTLDREHEIKRIHRDDGKPYTEVREMPVVGLSLDYVLYNSPIETDFDLLSIDTDWCNPQTLRGIDLDFWRPRLVVIEANGPEEKDPISQYMWQAGYTYAGISTNNMFWCRNPEDIMRVSGIHE